MRHRCEEPPKGSQVDPWQSSEPAGGTIGRRCMSDVFISYAREDRAVAEKLAACLAEAGYSVFWDRHIRTGTPFGRVLEQELAAAGCVLVLWSPHSITSGYVHDEAADARDRGLLLPIALQGNLTPPLGFRHLQTATLIGWDGEASRPDLLSLLRDIEVVVRPASPRKLSAVPGIERPGGNLRRLRFGGRSLLAAFVALIVVAAGSILYFRYYQGSEAQSEKSAPTDTQRRTANSGGVLRTPTSGSLFQVDLLDAGFGGSYLVRYGDSARPRFVLVDGGNAGTFAKVLAPELDRLRARWSLGQALPLELVVVTHIDDANVRGVLDFFQVLEGSRESGQELPYSVRRLWFNGFDLPVPPSSQTAAAPSLVPAVAYNSALHAGGMAAIVSASVRQGYSLLTHAKRLGIPINKPFDRLVMLPDRGAARITLDGGLQITVLGPRRERLEQSFEEWLKHVQRSGAGIDPSALDRWKRDLLVERFSAPEIERLAPSSWSPPRLGSGCMLDRSVPNLSSIVLLLEFSGKKLLFTGDARGDDILLGLAQAGYISDSGRLRVDLLQVPHQGSDRNVCPEFFQTVTAEVYVLGGDGTFGNPNSRTLQMIAQARGNDVFSFYFTHPDGKDKMRERLSAFFQEEQNRAPHYRVVFRAASSAAMHIDLLRAPNH